LVDLLEKTWRVSEVVCDQTWKGGAGATGDEKGREGESDFDLGWSMGLGGAGGYRGRDTAGRVICVSHHEGVLWFVATADLDHCECIRGIERSLTEVDEGTGRVGSPGWNSGMSARDYLIDVDTGSGVLDRSAAVGDGDGH